MNKNILFYTSALFLLLPGLAFAGDFVCRLVDQTSGEGDMVVAAARNDGVNRLYVSGGWCLYEYTWQDSVWHKDTVESVFAKVPTCLASGNGRNDGLLRLYGGVWGRDLNEYSYEGGVWNTASIDSVRYVGRSVAVGDIKNDDTMRVVAGGIDGVTMSYTYQSSGNTWRAETLGVNTDEIAGITIGKGRNDDTNRVYSGGWSTKFYEYWYRNNVWYNYFITNGVYNSVVGKGRNDDTNRLYGVGLAEDTWTLDHWQYNALDTNDNSFAGNAVLMDGRNDSKNRLYVAARGLGGPIDTISYEVFVLEKTYDSLNGWTRKEMRAVIYEPYTFMWDITAGKARNDTINRIYARVYDSDLFEFTWEDTINGVGQGDIKEVNDIKVRKVLNVGPNPFYSFTSIANMPNNAEIKIYDITGRLVEKSKDKNIGHNLKSGIYFIMAKGYKPGKIIKIK